MQLTQYISGLIASSVLLKICLVFKREDKKIINQFCKFGKDCDRNADRLSKNDEKLQYLH